jgi:hypothetical protein
MLLPGDLIEFGRAQEDEVILMQVREHVAGKGGGAFTKIRRVRVAELRTPLPSQIPRTRVDDVAAGVIHCLRSTAGTAHDLGISITWADLALTRLY